MLLLRGNACWQAARRSRVKTTVPTSGSSANCRASYYFPDYSTAHPEARYLAALSSETNCDGNCKYNYGVTCVYRWGRPFNVPAHLVCNGYEHCDDGSDERNCTVNNSTLYTCTHYFWEMRAEPIVPIHNYTRCSVVDIINNKLPYCLNYLDQTNCSDIERVGGYCEVNGYMSSVSKYMVCYEYDRITRQDIQLCDDDIQNNCISPSNSDCRVHKHLMCNGVKDCPDGSDETHDMCEVTSGEYNFACRRRFQPKIGDTVIPLSWIMDNATDCMKGEDESLTIWVVCSGNMLSPANYQCKNGFVCPGRRNASLYLDNVCNGIESCGKGTENKICLVARDLSFVDSTSYVSTELIRDACQATDCERRKFIRPWGIVFGEMRLEALVPKKKVNCSKLFGEYYLYLSCMGLCMEDNVSCPLNGNNRMLEYNSCSSQYQNRVFTIGMNSFLTFVDESNDGHYHQNFYQCDNGRCIEYKQVCDLVDDCGDMSDEINCANHMICENTLNSIKHQFISLSQKCDGIYDCFDLSDECNDLCVRNILEHWLLKTVCWCMGVLALTFNFLSLKHGLSSIIDNVRLRACWCRKY